MAACQFSRSPRTMKCLSKLLKNTYNSSSLCSISNTNLLPNTHSQFVIPTLSFSTTKLVFLKEISVIREGDVTTIEGNYVNSDRKDHMVTSDVSDVTDACPLCRLDLKLHYSDVLILSQFMRADGMVLPKEVTGVCRTQQYRLEKLIDKAKQAGLMPTLRPDLPSGEPDPHIRPQYKYMKYNVYYKDS